MFLKKLPRNIAESCGKSSNYYNRINDIKNVLIKLSGGKIVEMLTSVLTNDEVSCFLA
jgi:hypothetical protein